MRCAPQMFCDLQETVNYSHLLYRNIIMHNLTKSVKILTQLVIEVAREL